MDTTLHIRITVRGRLSPRLATAFAGMTLSRRVGVTALDGEVADQAQLHALLSRVRDLGLELEAVTVCSEPRPPATCVSEQGDRR